MKQEDKGFQSFFKLKQKQKRKENTTARLTFQATLKKTDSACLTSPTSHSNWKEDYIRVGVQKQFREEHGFERKKVKIPFSYEEVHKKHIKGLQIHPQKDAEYFGYRIIYEEAPYNVETTEGNFSLTRPRSRKPCHRC